MAPQWVDIGDRIGAIRPVLVLEKHNGHQVEHEPRWVVFCIYHAEQNCEEMGQKPKVTAPVEEEELDECTFESDLLTNHQEKQHRHKWNSIDDKVGEPEEEDNEEIYRADNAADKALPIVRGAGAIVGAIE